MRFISYNQRGFTIIELLIATTVFSVLLLLVTTGVLNIGKNYYRGTLQSRTQETARNIIDEISRGIQFSGEEVKLKVPAGAIPGTQYGFCVNGVGYAYILDNPLDSTADQALISYPQSCSSFVLKSPADAALVIGNKELLGIGMRITELNVESIPSISNTYKITVGVGSGDRELFDPPSPALSERCKIARDGHFCSVSKLTTIVQKRVQ